MFKNDFRQLNARTKMLNNANIKTMKKLLKNQNLKVLYLIVGK